jgi:hypothetical protein
VGSSVKVDGVAVNNNDFVSAADIVSGKLTFSPASGAHGTAYASFNFQVQDDGGVDHNGADLDPAPKSITIDVFSGTPTATFNRIFSSVNEGSTNVVRFTNQFDPFGVGLRYAL